MLLLIATPIGNLQDITLRALESVKSCTYLLCEDTRRTRTLLAHYSLHIPLKSFHLFNESTKENRIISDLKQGKTIGVVSDAGTPGIADPGERLIRRCRSEEIPVVPIPGPCALICALSASGFSTDTFQFLGFLPRKGGKLQKILEEILVYKGTSICYESPHRIGATLQKLALLEPERECIVARELTKKFETWSTGTASTLSAQYTAQKPKGEIVLLISGVER